MNCPESTHLLLLLDTTIQRIRAAAPYYTPPPFSLEKLFQLIHQRLDDFAPDVRLSLLEKLRCAAQAEPVDRDSLEDIWYLLHYAVQRQPDLLKQPLHYTNVGDEWGFDPEFLERIKPYAEFLYSRYWRVSVTGLENVPAHGRALLVANHSGQYPFDGLMLGICLLNEHPAHRILRTLYAGWFRSLPFLSTLLTRLGQVLANEENAVRLLKEDQLVAVFPEGYKGISKEYKYRYHLKRFGRGGYLRIALRSNADIIPVSIVGAEEMYMTLLGGAWGEAVFGYPVPGITVTWPWLGVLGAIPLPTKWYIDIGEPISLERYGSSEAGNAYLISQLNDQVRNTIQNMLYQRLAQRRHIFI